MARRAGGGTATCGAAPVSGSLRIPIKNFSFALREKFFFEKKLWLTVNYLLKNAERVSARYANYRMYTYVRTWHVRGKRLSVHTCMGGIETTRFFTRLFFTSCSSLASLLMQCVFFVGRQELKLSVIITTLNSCRLQKTPFSLLIINGTILPLTFGIELS